MGKVDSLGIKSARFNTRWAVWMISQPPFPKMPRRRKRAALILLSTMHYYYSTCRIQCRCSSIRIMVIKYSFYCSVVYAILISQISNAMSINYLRLSGLPPCNFLSCLPGLSSLVIGFQYCVSFSPQRMIMQVHNSNLDSCIRTQHMYIFRARTKIKA